MGVCSEVVLVFKILETKVGGITIEGSEGVIVVVMVIDSAMVGIGMGSATEIDGKGVVIVLETLDGLGGGLVKVPKGM